MNFARRLVLAALALLCCSLEALAAPYPTEAQLRAALAEAGRVLEPEGLELHVVEGKKAGVNLPLLSAGLNVKTGACVIFFNTEPEKELAKFFAKIEDDRLPTWLNSIAVHEAAHCVEQREAYLRNQFDKVLPASIERANMTLQAYSAVVKSGAVHTWGEALADIASLLYLKQAVPNEWQTYAKGIAQMRHDLAWKWPTHDTSAWLNAVIAANPEPAAGESLFETAFRLRRQHQPPK